MPKNICGQMWQRDGGVDLECVIKNKPFKLRLRFCLDAARKVRLIGTGVLDGRVVTVQVTGKGVRCAQKARPFVKTCLKNATRLLVQEASRYVNSFPVQCRAMLDVRDIRAALRII